MKFCLNTERARGGPGIRLSILLLSCWAALGQVGAPLAAVRDVKVAALEELTRVTVLVDGLIDIKADRVDNPARVFVDFARTRPLIEGMAIKGGVGTIGSSGKLLKQIRVAENQKGLTRLVFDLLIPDVDYRTIALKEPNRLVVELRIKGRGTWRNPLAAPVVIPPSAVPPRVLSRVVEPRRLPVDLPVRQRSFKSTYVMPDPPVLLSEFKLPKAEPGQMPYRVSGYVFRDFRLKLPPSTISRQSDQSLRPAVAATRNSAGRQSLTRVLGLKIGKVVIDPGHGGHDAGSTGATGLVEKDVTLDVARRLATLLETSLGSEVILTRNEDVYVSPEQRTAIANRHHADLFISIHGNSSTLRTASGVETYYLNFTTSAEALEVAARENASSERSVSDLGDLVKKIALKDKLDESREFAGKVQQTLYSGSVKAGNRTKDRGVRKAPFIVLIGAGMPSVLTEIGFLSNPKEEALLRKPEYRQKIAEALCRGVAQYAGTLSHFSIAQAGLNAEN